MKRIILFNLVIPALIILSTSALTNAQAPGPQGLPDAKQGPPGRPNLLKELGLTPEQVQQIRKINGEFRLKMRDATQKFHEATRALDEAIYQDEASEATISARKTALQEAHQNMINARVATETAIRNVLTKEQLVKFRALRQQFQRRQGMKEGPQTDGAPGGPPNRRFGNRPRRPVL